MEEEPNTNGETQETQPAKGDPVRIPVPKRKDVFRDLEKVAKPRKRPSPEDDQTQRT
jgi:hypothetical protein